MVPLEPPFAAAWDPEPRRTFAVTIVRVETDEGLIGIGSGDTMDGFEAYEHLFVGQDPLAVPATSGSLETIDFHAGRYWPLEAALWDIAGQVAGLPVATLFGGATRRDPGLRLVRHRCCRPPRVPSPRLRLREEGFRAMKIRVDPRHLEEGLAAVAATRDAVGDAMAIMVDLNQGWRMPGDTTPVLDPVAARNVAAQLAALRRAVARGAAGRHGSARAGGTARLRAGRPDRRWRDDPDVRRDAGRARCRCLRRLPARRRARGGMLADPHARRAGPRPQPLVHAAHLDERHRPAANLHVAAGVGGGPFIEYPYDPPGWTPERRDAFLAEPIRPDRDGVLRVPAAAGLGAVLDEAAIARYAA